MDKCSKFLIHLKGRSDKLINKIKNIKTSLEQNGKTYGIGDEKHR